MLPWDDSFTHADSRLDHHLYPGMLFHFPDYLLFMDLPHQCSLGQGRGVIPATVKIGTAYATSSSVEKVGFLAFACPAPPGCRGASLARGTYNIHSWSWRQHDGLGCPPSSLSGILVSRWKTFETPLHWTDLWLLLASILECTRAKSKFFSWHNSQQLTLEHRAFCGCSM